MTHDQYAGTIGNAFACLCAFTEQCSPRLSFRDRASGKLSAWQVTEGLRVRSAGDPRGKPAERKEFNLTQAWELRCLMTFCSSAGKLELSEVFAVMTGQEHARL